MSLTGAITNSVSALLSESTAMGTISQNIANVSTTGYKTAETDFATLLSANSTDTSAYGVTTNTRTLNNLQGTITSSTSSTDLAISGQGFFVLNSSIDGTGTTYYTRDGSIDTTAGTSVSDTASTGLAYLTVNGEYVMGWPAGSVPSSETTSSDGLTAISYDKTSTLAATATTTVSVDGTVPVSGTDVVSGSVSVYDDTGTSTALTLTLEPTGTTNSWYVGFSLPDGEGTVTSGSTTLTFDSDGNVTEPTGTVTLDVTWADGTTGTMSVDLSSLSVDGTSTSPSFTDTTDGYAEGSFESISIDSSGTVYANYDNDQSVAIATVALAQFIEPNNLNTVSDNMFTANASAGTAQYGTTSTLPGVTIETASLESSTVDINTQMTDMIGVQQAYSSASELWGVCDDMMKTVRDLVTT